MKEYCIAATKKDRSIRHSITGPMSKPAAEAMLLDRSLTKYYIYPKVAKFPYKARKHGG